MSEINGHQIGLNHTTFNGVQRQNSDGETVANTEQAPQLKDFSNSKAEALGRSMLLKGADNINNDLKTLMENPQIAENSDEMFELAFKAAQDAGAENPYEEAASASTTSV